MIISFKMSPVATVPIVTDWKVQIQTKTTIWQVKQKVYLKGSSLIYFPTGWVKFSLKNSENMATDKWQKAFHFCKMGAVRCILDKGQPLTKGKELFLLGLFVYVQVTICWLYMLDLIRAGWFGILLRNIHLLKITNLFPGDGTHSPFSKIARYMPIDLTDVTFAEYMLFVN